jgi:hypothetical protein
MNKTRTKPLFTREPISEANLLYLLYIQQWDAVDLKTGRPKENYIPSEWVVNRLKWARKEYIMPGEIPTENNKLMCHYENCDRTYRTKKDLSRHIKSIHEKILKKCRYCDKKYVNGKSNLFYF